MAKNYKQKAASQRKLNFDDSGVSSNAQPRGQKRSASPPKANSQNMGGSYESPQKKVATQATSINVVTPNESEVKKRAAIHTNDDDYVPSYVHKNVEYVRKDHITKISPLRSKVLQWITDNYYIPKDFEQNRKYGPLSGSSYVDRVVASYRLGLLQRSIGSDEGENNSSIPSAICTVCADLGHNADTCPTLL